MTSGERAREVKMSDAVLFAKYNRLSAVIETSAKDDLFISDAFYISAINCFEQEFMTQNSLNNYLKDKDSE